MIQTLIKNWWLLALCGLLDAILAVMNVCMQDPEGSLTWRVYVPMSTGMLMCRLALVAGACAIAAGIWRSRNGKSWLLVLNGLAFVAYGLIPLVFSDRPLSFRLFALLVVVMAMSMGVLELAIARSLRRHLADEWFLGLAGAASVGFALAFLALASGWIKLEPAPGSHSAFLWLASYFGCSAICMVGFALRLQSEGLSRYRRWEASPPLGNPKYVH